MLKLYGFPVSNYVNMVHLALMAKRDAGMPAFIAHIKAKAAG